MVPERFRAISPSVANLRQLSPADKQCKLVLFQRNTLAHDMIDLAQSALGVMQNCCLQPTNSRIFATKITPCPGNEKELSKRAPIHSESNYEFTNSK